MDNEVDIVYGEEVFDENEQLNIYKGTIYKLKEERQKVLDQNFIELDGRKLIYEIRYKGEKPSEGYSLYFGMHGGGGCTKDVNDGQWENHKKQYVDSLENGSIWFAPRSPEDCWNMWHLPYIDDMFDYIIQSFLILELINPNKVYFTGYSAGGDGTFKLANRLADRIAGAVMCAGHPNGVSMLSLRNIFFSIQMGGLDYAFKRNDLAREYGQKLSDLRNRDPEGYDHCVNIHEECGHWMNRKEAHIFDVLRSKVRNPYPKKIVWKQCCDNPKQDFYWLSLSKNMCIPDSHIEARIEGNSIYLNSDQVDEIKINLNENLVNFNEQVKVIFNDSLVFNDCISVNQECIKESVEKRYDPYLIYTCSLVVKKN